MADVGPEGASHAAHVDAAMLVEALVLDRHDRVLQPRGDPIRRDDDPRLRAPQDREHRVAVRGIDIGVRLRPLRLRVELRDLRSDRGQKTEGEGRRAQQPENDEQGKESKLADATAFRPAAISPEERQNRGSLAPVVTQSAASDLTSHAVDVLPEGALDAKLKLGRPLRVKLGVDPTSPDVHLGFAYVLERLADFQRAGHQIVLIVGDYTARIGDPSGLSKERPILDDDVLDANSQFFAEQAFRILDRERTEVRLNGEWLGALSYADTVRLARTMTVARLLERDDFAKRFSGHVPISLSELLYPIMQAYDSVAIKADVEIGGTDQRFNLLAGRDVMPQYGLEAQVVVTFPLLVGTDGELKMSKSRGQLHRDHRPARGDVREDDVDPGRSAASVVGDARRRRASGRADGVEARAGPPNHGALAR